MPSKYIAADRLFTALWRIVANLAVISEASISTRSLGVTSGLTRKKSAHAIALSLALDEVGKANMRGKMITQRRFDDPQAIVPRTLTERQLIQIWREVLQIDEIGLREDFIDLGGESILATQCLSRIRIAFDVELGLQIFFSELANVEELARIIDVLRERGAHCAEAEDHFWPPRAPV